MNPEAQTRKRILLVEDEAMVAMLIEDILADLHCELAGTASRLHEALNMAQTAALDVAILDVNLAGETTFPVADALKARRIPFIFATGYGASQISDVYADVPTLPKPFQAQDLARALEVALRLNALQSS